MLGIALSVLGIGTKAQADCRTAGCIAVKKVLAASGSGFTPLRGAVLSRQANKRPDEYAGNTRLAGAERCTVEVVGGENLYLCVYPSQKYAGMMEQYGRLVADVKDAIPPNWVTWEKSAPGRADEPGPAKAFRAGPMRERPLIEVITMMPAGKPPHLAVLVHSETRTGDGH